jgi:prolyl oligopeptidase
VRFRLLLLLPVLGVSLLPCLSAARADDRPASGKPDYPDTRRVDAKDVLHGVDVPDPYRWLEDNESKEVEAWDFAQNALLRARLDACPGRAELEARLHKELDLGGIESLPRFAGEFAFHTYAAPGENHAVLYVRDAAGKEPPRVVLDPNAWSKDGTQGLRGWTPSPDGRYVVYGRDQNASEEATLYVHDLKTGLDLTDRITRAKHTSVAWRPDSQSFYYTRQPNPDDVPAGDQEYHRRVFLHALGSLVADDPVVYGQGRPKIESMWVGSSTDERHQFVVRGIPYETLDTFEIEDGEGQRRLTPVLVGNPSRTEVDRVGDTYVLVTDFEAPKKRICTARRGESNDPAKWREIVPQSDAVIEATALCKDRLVVLRRDNLIARLTVVDLEGRVLGEVALPGAGTVGSQLAVKPGDRRLWLTFESYSVPPSTWVVDLGEAPTGEGAAARWTPKRLAILPTTIDVDGLVSERFDVPSKDGTKVPMFVLRAKKTPLDGSAPTLLYAYGGFRVGMYPVFSRSMALWVELGGVYAVASLRGGDEFGEDWHCAGCLANKQNVFDDFIACADWLVTSGKAKRERLAIMGGSNGGLLVATVTNQRPDLCRAVVCSVPLTDMLRFHRFQYALTWTKEYGDPDVKEQFDWIRPYSPYHNVKAGTAYPAILVTAGLSDKRVNAFHARKIVAQWQAATSSDRPVLLHLDRQSGHSSASLQQAKRERLDRFCFLRIELGGP